MGPTLFHGALFHAVTTFHIFHVVHMPPKYIQDIPDNGGLLKFTTPDHLFPQFVNLLYKNILLNMV
jgi:hypothetical protein